MDRLTDFALRHPKWAALVLGLAAATGYPPLGLWPLALVAMGAFVWLLHRSADRKSAFTQGWLFGVAHFTLTNNWIATAFTYQAEMPAVLGWVAVPLLSLYLAVWPALAALAAKLIGRDRPLWLFALVFGACWIAAEWFRSWVFTGYAWGPFSLSLLGGWSRPGVAALLPWTGTYALSGLAVALCGIGAWLTAARRWVPLGALALAAIAGMLLPAGLPRDGILPLTLVQPNLRQEEIDDPTKYEEQFQRIAALSRPRRQAVQRLVLWPESGVPDYLRGGYPQRYYDQMTAGGSPIFARYRIGQAIGEGSLLLTGAVDLEMGDVDGRLRAVGAYNAITPVRADGTLGPRYAKAHLVPYGEYLPMRALLEPIGLSRLVAGTLDFVPGPGPQTIGLGAWGKAGMQICYEIVFSGEVVERGDRPDYIFNPSNDGWFGYWGPPQHLGQARMRAIEEGLPVLRSTTTGISAVIDARGVVRNHIGRGEAARIDTLVPPAHAPTLFARAGHWLTLAWTLALLALSAVAIGLARRYGSGST
ncbi:MAG: apolipoprotein N-acyltransferase [Citromicrobium sp.]|nr:MAG: apolipoprotein N-acyltransferase [Citromicrobium sp.]